ncbi:unnamed protein product [Cochlearia groenlandica]
MKSFKENYMLITDKRRKRVKANLYDSNIQIISRASFEAAVFAAGNRDLAVHGRVTPIMSITSSSSIEMISRGTFEASVKKETTTTPESSLWSKTIWLGEGSQGVVYLAKRSPEAPNDEFPLQMAIKSVTITNSSNLKEEESTTSEASKDKINYNLILEFCSGGSIADHLKTRKQRMSETEVQLLALHILRGINYIHSKQIIHCDIKPGNILLKPQEDCKPNSGFNAKLADFGLSMSKTSEEYGDGLFLKRGTLLYICPELLNCGKLDYGADIWSFGCTILEMLTGKKPWSELGFTDRKKISHVIGDSNATPFIPEFLSGDAKSFLEKCLVRDFKKRADSVTLLNHSFLDPVRDL